MISNFYYLYLISLGSHCDIQLTFALNLYFINFTTIPLIMAENEGENKFNRQFLGALNSASVSSKLSDIIKAVAINIEKSIYEEINKKFGELSTTINMLIDEDVGLLVIFLHDISMLSTIILLLTLS